MNAPILAQLAFSPWHLVLRSLREDFDKVPLVKFKDYSKYPNYFVKVCIIQTSLGWYDFGTIYIQNRSTLFDYFQLGVWTKSKFYAGFIEFCTKGKIDNSAFAMQRSGIRPSSTPPFVFSNLQRFWFRFCVRVAGFWQVFPKVR
jgi:hypothetical protein